MTTAALPRREPPRAAPTAPSSVCSDAPMLRLRIALPLAVVAGVLLDLSTPDVGWWPLAFISVSLSLMTLIGRSIGGALAVGILFGASFYTLHLAWVGQFLGPVPRLALSSLRYEVGHLADDGREAAAAGHFVHVYVDRATRRPVPLPQALRTVLERLRPVA